MGRLTMRRVAGTLIFIASFALLYSALSFVITPHTDRDSIWKTFLRLPKNSVDAIFTGTSKIHANVNPVVLWKTKGITSYDLSGSSMDLNTTYRYLEQAFLTQRPKVVGIEMLMMRDDNLEIDKIQRRNITFMPFGVPKIKAAFDRLKPSEVEYWTLPVSRFHSRVLNSDIKRTDFAWSKWDGAPNIFFGYRCLDRVEPQVAEGTPTPLDPVLYKTNYALLRKSIDLARFYGAKVVILETPHAKADMLKYYREALAIDLATDYPDVVMWTMADYAKTLNVNHNTEFYDELHLNRTGGERFTTLLGNHIAPLVGKVAHDKQTQQFYNTEQVRYEAFKPE